MSEFKVGDEVFISWAQGWPTTRATITEEYWAGGYEATENDGGLEVFVTDNMLTRVEVDVNNEDAVEESEPEESPEPDMVDRPNHYTAGMPEGVEVIDIINAQEAGYLHGNVLKYMLRWKFKNGLEDLKKARVYLNWLIEKVEAGDEG